jgi:hypothetical protein
VCESPLSIGHVRFGRREFGFGDIDPALSLAAKLQRQRQADREIALVRRPSQSASRVFKIDRGIRAEPGLPQARTPALQVEARSCDLAVRLEGTPYEIDGRRASDRTGSLWRSRRIIDDADQRADLGRSRSSRKDDGARRQCESKNWTRDHAYNDTKCRMTQP